MLARIRHAVFTPLAGVVAAAVLAGIIAATGLSAQNPPGQQQAQPPVFKTAVNLVRVDIYPTLKGLPVEDLAQGEVEILENGEPQQVATFERVVVRKTIPGAARVEPRNLRESQAMAGDARNRLFVLFVDTYHLPGMFQGVDPGPSRRALQHMLRTMIGEDDLVALMTPEMDPAGLSFIRNTDAVETFLETRWHREIRVDDFDEVERMYQMCYPYGEGDAIVAEMIARRRERLVFEKLRDTIETVRLLRDERKAILLVSQGWTLFGPNPQLARPLEDYPKPGLAPLGVGPTGRLGTKDDARRVPLAGCEKDRQWLANIDDRRDFLALAGQANRANASFYPIDPRGLEAHSRAEGASTLSRRRDMLLNLSTATDGTAVLDTNEFDRPIKRIVDDLSAYYLVGYYSTNAKLDGSYRKITVRVKRPGVSVRARDGYLAPTAAEAGSAAAAPPADRETAALKPALALLDQIRADRTLRTRVSWGWSGGGAVRAGALVSLVIELDAEAAKRPEWAAGATMRIGLLDAAGRELATSDAKVLPAARSVVATFAGVPVGPGRYSVRAAIVAGVQAPVEPAFVTIPEDRGPFGEPLLYRRGPYTGPGFHPTADLRFRRAERIRLELPLAGAAEQTATLAARLLDRNGKPLAVPVALNLAAEGSLANAEIVLTPLAVGDYLVEFALGSGPDRPRRLVPFRIIP